MTNESTAPSNPKRNRWPIFALALVAVVIVIAIQLQTAGLNSQAVGLQREISTKRFQDEIEQYTSGVDPLQNSSSTTTRDLEAELRELENSDTVSDRIRRSQIQSEISKAKAADRVADPFSFENLSHLNQDGTLSFTASATSCDLSTLLTRDWWKEHCETVANYARTEIGKQRLSELWKSLRRAP